MSENSTSDNELLATYRRRGGESQIAFTDLVSRHGGMVYHACLRVLGNSALAEDASQAAFVVFARKAQPGRGSVEGFLHRVAVNVAKRARDAERSRKRHESEAAMAGALRREGASEPEVWNEIKPHLDEAIERLPRMQRIAVTMCLLEGGGQESAAKALGISRTSVSSYLQRAREKLRVMLSRHAKGLSVAVLAGFLAERSGEATCPAFLTAAAEGLAASGMAGAGVGAGTGAAALSSNVALMAKGAIKMMFWAKAKVAAWVLASAAVVGTAAPLTYQAVAAAEKTAPEKKLVAATASGEEVFRFRRIAFEGYAWFHPARKDFSVAWSKEQALAQIGPHMGKSPFMKRSVRIAANWKRLWIDSLKIDFKKEMLVAVLQPHARGRLLMIDKVSVAGGAVRVQYGVGKCKEGEGRGFDLIVCPRREKPVVFYENGEKVAEVLPLRKLKPTFKSGLLASKQASYRACRSFSEAADLPYFCTMPLAKMPPGVPQPQRTTIRHWLKRQKFDFKKEMFLAAFKGHDNVAETYAVTKITVIENEMRVDILHAPSKKKVMGNPYDLVACPRRDLPVVFYENGKEVARVPLKKAAPRAQWNRLEETLTAVSAGGKILWKHKTGFPIGRLNERGGKWYVDSEDGTVGIILDPHTGKLLGSRRSLLPESLLKGARELQEKTMQAYEAGRYKEVLKHCWQLKAYATRLKRLGKAPQAAKILEVALKLQAEAEAVIKKTARPPKVLPPPEVF